MNKIKKGIQYLTEIEYVNREDGEITTIRPDENKYLITKSKFIKTNVTRNTKRGETFIVTIRRAEYELNRQQTIF